MKYMPRRPRFKISRQFERPPDFSSVAHSVLDTPKARWKYMQRMKAIFAGRPLTFIWEEDPEVVPPSTPARVDLRVRRHAKIKMSTKKSPISRDFEMMGDDDDQPQSAQQDREEDEDDLLTDPEDEALRDYGKQWVTFCKNDKVMVECERVSSVVVNFVMRHTRSLIHTMIHTRS